MLRCGSSINLKMEWRFVQIKSSPTAGARNRLTEERIEIIEELFETNPEFGAPNDYKPLKKTQKIFLPDNTLAPDMNYVGMILGPKGKTQKELERKTGCKISIRGRGSQKSKKNQYEDGEKLHIMLHASTDDQIEKGSALIQRVRLGEKEELP